MVKSNSKNRSPDSSKNQSNFDSIEAAGIKIEDESKFMDETYQGVRFPESMGNNGRVKSSSCTDLFGIILLIIYCIGLAAIIFFAYGSSDISSLAQVADADGNICGKSKGFEDYSYLYMFNFDKPYTSVCVKKCPAFDYNQIRYNSTGTWTKKLEVLKYSGLSAEIKNLGTTKTNGEVDAKPKTKEIFGYDPEIARGFYTKNKWDSYLGNFVLDCKPNKKTTSCSYSPEKQRYYYDSERIGSKICVPKVHKIVSSTNLFGQSTSLIRDLYNSYLVIGLSILIALIFALLVALISAHLASEMFWIISTIGTLVLFILGIALAFAAYTLTTGTTADYMSMIGFSATKNKDYYKSLEHYYIVAWVLAAVCFIASMVMAYSICTKRTLIDNELNTLELAANFVQHDWSTLVVSFVYFFLLLASIIGLLLGLAVVYTSGGIDTDSEKGYPFPGYKKGILKYCELGFIGFGIYWILNFWNYACEFTIGAASTDYYFKNESSIWSALVQTFFFHLGTIAFSSLFLTPVSILQALLEWINQIGDFIHAQGVCYLCCLPYRKFIERTNNEGYTQVYLCQINFCPASRKDYYLRERIEENIGSIHWVSSLFTMCSKLIIALVPSIFAYFIIDYFDFYHGLIVNKFAPQLLIFFISFILGHVFMSIFDSASRAFTTCYYIQIDSGAALSHPKYFKRPTETKENDGNKYDKLA